MKVNNKSIEMLEEFNILKNVNKFGAESFVYQFAIQIFKD